MTPPRPVPLLRLELHTGDLRGAQELLGAVCGWDDAGSSADLDLGCGLSGRIVENRTRRSLWLPHLAVASVDEATDRARGCGAFVVLEPDDGPAGRRSVIATSAGAELALWESQAPHPRR